MEEKIDTCENCIRVKTTVLKETSSDIEKKIEDSNTKNLDDENIKTMERKIYILEKCNLNQTFLTVVKCKKNKKKMIGQIGNENMEARADTKPQLLY